MDVFDIIKAKLPVEKHPNDTELGLKVAEVGQLITSYINRPSVPAELKFVHANMVLDLINSEERKADPDAQQTVASVKEGDTTVQYGAIKVEAREKATEQLLFDYSKQLNRFRKLRW